MILLALFYLFFCFFFVWGRERFKSSVWIGLLPQLSPNGGISLICNGCICQSDFLVVLIRALLSTKKGVDFEGLSTTTEAHSWEMGECLYQWSFGRGRLRRGPSPCCSSVCLRQRCSCWPGCRCRFGALLALSPDEDNPPQQALCRDVILKLCVGEDLKMVAGCCQQSRE